MYTFETKLRVRYAETDQMAFVYYGNYASYFEVARVDMLRSIGLSYKAMEESGIMMPVLELKSKYDDTQLISLFENYEITKLDINRIYRYLEKYTNENTVEDEVICDEPDSDVE